MVEKSEIIQRLDKSVLAVIGSKALLGFEKAHVVANAINELKALLTDDYMRPIMALQGNKLGFRTDKDKTGGYDIPTVRNCLIEAVLMGLQPTGNQFNIIAGNTYPTKEGCGYLLNTFEGLQEHQIICGLPRINDTKTSAAVEVTISWTINGQKNEKVVPIPIKMDAYTSVDSLIGKATRKGRAWLLSRILGTEITDGEVEDTVGKVISSSTLRKTVDQQEEDRLKALINDAPTVEVLESYKEKVKPDQVDLFNQKMEELKTNAAKPGKK